MIPRDFRLDSVAVHLIERLEGTRRSYLDRPEKAREKFARIADDLVGAAAAECREYVEGDEYPQLLHREIHETFLPRYTRLALEHNQLEKSRFGAWRGGDPLFRVGAVAAAVVAAGIVTRAFPSVYVAVIWIFVLAFALMPELRAAWHRRLYQRDLQAIVDDMGRIHDQLDVYDASPAPLVDAKDPALGEASQKLRNALGQAEKTKE